MNRIINRIEVREIRARAALESTNKCIDSTLGDLLKKVNYELSTEGSKRLDDIINILKKLDMLNSNREEESKTLREVSDLVADCKEIAQESK